ncbi:MAG: SUMF1/EgtB/PvdO family nonheme iron enzyme [Chitinophagales bacterium]
MASQSNPVKIFIAYSRLDGEYLEALRKYLKPLDRNKTIRIWYDGEIVPGSIWEQSIKDNLYTADIILLLVSANSLASDYFYDKEMADALARHQRGEAIVVPIILAHCAWDITELSELQALPKDGKPISDWADDSKAYTDIVRGLNRSVLEVKTKQNAAAAEILQKKQEAEAERQRKIAAAKEQERLAQLQRQTKETQKKQEIAAERRRKDAEEQERLRQLELQKEREKLAEQEAQAEQQRLTHFKQSLLEADKALLHQNWTTAISAFEESLKYYKTGDQPDKKSIEQNIKNAQQKQREAQIIALKENPKVRYGSMAGGVLLLLLLVWGISKMIPSTTNTNAKTPPPSEEAGRRSDSTAEYQRLFQTATDLKDKKTYEQAILYADSALMFKPEDKDALALKKDSEIAEKEQSKPEKEAAETKAYTELIQKADRHFKAEKWADAKSDYTAALALQPKEKYPSHQLEKIEIQLNKIAQSDAAQKEQERKNSQYNQLLADASKAYDRQEYNASKSKYQEALQLKPAERGYLQGKIDAIDKILNPPPKPKPEPAKETTSTTTPPPSEKVGSRLHPEIQKLINNMVTVSGGTFQMGSNDGQDDEKPVHPVTLSTFQMGKYEVTQAQWEAVMGSNPSQKSAGCDNCPVESVSWNDAQDFIKKLNQLTGKRFRLPTEAEWEFAARGGTKSRNYTYSGSNSIDEVAWYGDNSGSKTHPVGGKKANELGLYDMSGNVWEWCNDWYDENYYSSSPSSNPKGPATGGVRVLRGGSWNNKPLNCRSADRFWFNPEFRINYGVGFRCAKTP